MPAEYDYDLVCIGSGPAGQHAAVQAAKTAQARARRRAAAADRRGVPGRGHDPSKTLREAVLWFKDHERGAQYGLSPPSRRFVFAAVGTRPAEPPGIATDGGTIVDSDQILALAELPCSGSAAGVERGQQAGAVSRSD